MKKGQATATAPAKTKRAKKEKAVEVNDEVLSAEIITEEPVIEDKIRITPDLISAGRTIAETTAVLEIHIRKPGFAKRIKSDSFLEVSGNNGEVDADILKVSQEIIDRRELKQLATHRKQFLRYLQGLEIPGGLLTLGGGQYLIPLSKCREVRDSILEFQAKREELLNDFEERYPEIIESSKIKRGAFYDPLDYPSFSVIRSRYTLDYKFISNTVPEELAKVSQELYDAEKERISLECASAASEIRDSLRASFKTLVAELVDRLGTEEDGTEKTLHKSKVTKLQKFINDFSALDLTQDADLQKLIQDSQAIMMGVDTDDLKDSTTVRESVKESFATVIQQLDSMVTPATRTIDLD